MDSKLSSQLETVAFRLENKESSSREVDELYNSNCRLLSTSPAEAVCGDSPGDQNEDMAIEDACDLNWDDTSITPSGAIPLGPPTSYDELTTPTGPESPNYKNDLEKLFNTDNTDQNNEDFVYGTPGVCGLGNLGNTCFMNSGLQCLMSTPALVQMYWNYSKDASPTETLATHFANLFQKVWSGDFNKVKPSEFQQAFANQHSQFKDYRQHDCQEFLALLLGSLHELLNTASSKSHVSDLSADPMTPRSVGDESAVAAIDAVETDSTSQMALSVGSRCEGSSSSSRSSESSITASNFRLRPLPYDVKPFNSAAPPTTTTLFWDPMDSDGEKDVSISDECRELITTLDETNSNVIQQDALMRDSKINNLQAPLNNAPICLDISKDAKTSNVNVLFADSANNKIVFDSEKFPKHEITRRRDTCDSANLTGFHNFYSKTSSVKRIKETNKLQDCGDATGFAGLDASSELFNHTKRFKFQEKNVQLELERKSRGDDGDAGEFSGAVAMQCATLLEDDMEAEKQWGKHLNMNQSIIIESFLGQFKSTVVCSECHHVSSTYEPFMYLSVPLPHAMELQLCVTFVPASSAPPTKFLLTLNKQEKVKHIKEKLRTIMEANSSTVLEIAEVLQHHIARFLDENHQIRYLATSDPQRSIYAFEIADDATNESVGSANSITFCPEPLDLTQEESTFLDKSPQLNNRDVRKQDGDAKISSFTNNLQSCDGPPDIMDFGDGNSQTMEKADDPKSCAICFEEMDKQFKNHKGCSCFLCDNCIENSIKHYTKEEEVAETDETDDRDQMKCPVCRELVSASSDFVDAEGANDIEASLRMLRIPVLFRLNRKSDNEDSDELFGHPHLIKVASRISGSVLHTLVRKLIPYHSEFSIVLVDGQGYRCSRCLYNAHCKGCPVAPDAEINLKRGDNLAVAFSQPVDEIEAIDHPSLRDLRKNEDLSLYDCLNAFCESETLDEHNPWYCPTCDRNQCATKTLSVWRYPDFLIVYLKRFVFHEYTSVKLDNKVSFPLVDFDVSSSMNQSEPLRYDLYACVNHLGGASAGHYTAYAKHPRSGDWHLFNDDTVTAQLPQENDYAHAYVLFYQRRGQQYTRSNGTHTSYHASAKFESNMDQTRFDFEPGDSKCRKPYTVDSM